jgi:hypothetical protein
MNRLTERVPGTAIGQVGHPFSFIFRLSFYACFLGAGSAWHFLYSTLPGASYPQAGRLFRTCLLRLKPIEKPLSD